MEGINLLTANHNSALKTICSHLKYDDFDWAITGSTSLILQGMDIAPNDIDIITNKDGAYKINSLLKAYETSPVSFSDTNKIRSHFGVFEIDGVKVEVMGDIQIKRGTLWKTIAHLHLPHNIELVKYNDMSVPVLCLALESIGNRALGRFERADEISLFIHSKP